MLFSCYPSYFVFLCIHILKVSWYYFLKCHNKFQLLRNVIAVLHQLKVSATIVAAVRNVEWGISSPSLLRSPVSHVRKDPIQGKCVKDFRNSRIQFSKFPDINCGFTVFREGPMFVAFVGNPCPMNVNTCTTICLIFIIIILITLSTKLCPPKPGKFWLPLNIDPHE